MRGQGTPSFCAGIAGKQARECLQRRQLLRGLVLMVGCI